MKIGLALSPCAISASSTPAYDVSPLAWDAWFRDYAGSPWSGTVSGGNSGAKTATGTATVGTAINGHAPASFNGTQGLTSVTTAAGFISTTAYRVCFVIATSTAAAPAVGAFDDPGIFTETGGNWGITWSTSGVKVYHFDGAYKVASKACAADGLPHAVDVVYDGVNITVTVDGVAGTPVAAGTCGSLAGAVSWGLNYNNAAKFTGSIYDFLSDGSAMSAMSAADFLSYKQGRYG